MRALARATVGQVRLTIDRARSLGAARPSIIGSRRAESQFYFFVCVRIPFRIEVVVELDQEAGRAWLTSQVCLREGRVSEEITRVRGQWAPMADMDVNRRAR